MKILTKRERERPKIEGRREKGRERERDRNQSGRRLRVSEGRKKESHVLFFG